jgi:hypothetical protein
VSYARFDREPGGCEWRIRSYTGAMLPCIFKPRLQVQGLNVCRRHASMLLRRGSPSPDDKWVLLARALMHGLVRRGFASDRALVQSLDRWLGAHRRRDYRQLDPRISGLEAASPAHTTLASRRLAQDAAGEAAGADAPTSVAELAAPASHPAAD